MKQLTLYGGLVAVAVALDQWIKYVVETRLVMHEQVDVLPFLALFRTYDTGIAFSMLSSFGDTGLIVVSLAVIAFVLYLASRSAGDQRVARIGFALIIGGAIGNLIDRARLGYVLDFVDVYSGTWHFWAFNVADAAISIGAILVILDLFGLRRNASHSV